MKVDWSQAPTSALTNVQSILNYQPKVVGTETVDGKYCLVVEYTADSSTSKMWIWQDQGLPVRIDSTTPRGQTTIEFKNYDFSDNPDNLFELPAGVPITNFNLPTGVSPSGVPNFPFGMPTSP